MRIHPRVALMAGWCARWLPGRIRLLLLARTLHDRPPSHSLRELNRNILRSCRNGDVAGAQETFLAMAHKGFLLPRRTMDEVLLLCETLKGAAPARQLAALLEARGVELENDLLRCCRERDLDLAGARRAFLKLTEKGCFPTPTTLGKLLHICESSGDAELSRSVVDFVLEKKVPLDEGLGNALARALLTDGLSDRGREVYARLQAEGVKVRMGTLSRLLELAAANSDLPFAHELLGALQRGGFMPDSVASRAVLHMATGLAAEEEEEEEGRRLLPEEEGRWLLESVLSLWRVGRGLMDEGVAEEVAAWARQVQRLRGVPESARLQEAHVCNEGVCSVCGWQLEECCLDDHQHRQLLSCSSQFLEEGANSFHNNRREVAEVKAFCMMLAEEGPFGAVVDGLNAAYSGGRISGHKVLQVAGEVQQALPGGVLVIARKHLASNIPIKGRVGAPPHVIHTHFRQRGLRFFFLENRVSDDLFFLHGCLACGPGTFLVSNDLLSDFTDMFPPEEAALFDRWKRSRLTGVLTDRGAALQFPPRVDQVVQWTDRGWHLPLHGGRWLCLRSNGRGQPDGQADGQADSQTHRQTDRQPSSQPASQTSRSRQTAPKIDCAHPPTN